LIIQSVSFANPAAGAVFMRSCTLKKRKSEWKEIVVGAVDFVLASAQEKPFPSSIKKQGKPFGKGKG